MVLASQKPVLVSLLLLLLLLPGCEKKDAEEPKTAVQTSEQTQPYITSRAVSVRSGPGTRYKVVAEIQSGTRVNVAGREEGWLKVVSKRGNPPGYIEERFARPAAQPATRSVPSVQGSFTTTSDTYVREGPGQHYKTVAKIDKGTKVNVVGAEGDWLKVQSKRGNPPGYIEKIYAQRRPG